MIQAAEKPPKVPLTSKLPQNTHSNSRLHCNDTEPRQRERRALSKPRPHAAFGTAKSGKLSGGCEHPSVLSGICLLIYWFLLMRLLLLCSYCSKSSLARNVSHVYTSNSTDKGHTAVGLAMRRWLLPAIYADTRRYLRIAGQ